MKKCLLAICSLLVLMLACSFQPQKVEVYPAAKASVPTVTIPHYALVCMAGTLNFRSRPGTDKEVEFTFPDGTLVQVFEDTESLPDGSTWRLTQYGYVNARYLCLEAE